MTRARQNAPPGAPTRWRALTRDLALGLGVLTVHFAIDAAESWVHVQQALRRVQASPEGTEQLLGAIRDHVAGTFAGYLLIGAWAGLVLHVWQGLVRPARPVRAGIALLVTCALLLNLLELIRLPAEHDWFLYRAEVVRLVPWQAPVVALILLVAGSLWGGFRRIGASRSFTTHAVALGGLVTLPMALAHVPTPPAPRPNAGPNVILLSFDALRPDHLGYFGYRRPIAPDGAATGTITPNLDAFLAESSVWTAATTPLARTWPAWAALLTGSLPVTTGYRDPLPAPARLHPPVPTLPQVLHDQGWTTAFRTDDSRFSYMVPEWGWDRIEQPPVSIANFAISGSEPRFRAFLGLLDNPLGWALVPVIRQNQAFGRSYRNTRFNADTLATLADLSAGGRFFYAVHDCTLHAPADRHYPQTTLFGQDAYSGENRFRYMSSGSTSVSDERPEDAERRAADQNVNLYDAGVVMIDHTFGGIVASLKASGLWDTSIVFVMSDHGEDLLDAATRYRYNGPNHGFHPWGQAQYRVLLAAHWPAAYAAGHPPGEDDHLASLIDVAPTLADTLGIPWKSDGRLLSDTTDRVLYTETGLSEISYFPIGHRTYPFRSSAATYKVEDGTGRVYQNPELWPTIVRVKDRFVTDDRYKLIWYAMDQGLTLDLYDWREDPENLHEISAEHPEVVARLWPALVERLRADNEVVPDDPSGAQPLRRPSK